MNSVDTIFQVDFSDVMKGLSKYRKAFQKALPRALERAGLRVLVPEAMKRTHIGETGHEKASWRVAIHSSDTLLFGNIQPYWKFTEYGTGKYNMFGNGRQKAWIWYSRTARWGGFFVKGKGYGHRTHGQKPQRTGWHTVQESQELFKWTAAKELLKEVKNSL